LKFRVAAGAGREALCGIVCQAACVSDWVNGASACGPRASAASRAASGARSLSSTAGYALRPVLLSLTHGGQNWVQENPTDVFTHNCGHELDIDYACRHCGEAITPGSYSISNSSDTPQPAPGTTL
jgi:hypothetical protein